ncbi:MAG: chorismate lyase [Burkholderiales bacterium]|nr:chorismate lyase [Burkholderiales bacterium]
MDYRRRAHDPFWQPWPLAADAAMRGWLLDRGSLTARLKARCPSFRVRLLHQGLIRPAREEAALLGLAQRERAIGRDVLLYCGSMPVVFAHSVVRAQDLRGAWRAIAAIGTRPLGAALFADPRIERHPLRFRWLGGRHPLYCAAAKALAAPLPRLPARRSLFVLHRAPLLVTEAFLPALSAHNSHDRS